MNDTEAANMGGKTGPSQENMRRSSGAPCGRRRLLGLDRLRPSDAGRKFPARLFVAPNPAANRASDASAPLVTTVDRPNGRLIVSALLGPPFNPHRLACHPPHPPPRAVPRSSSSTSSSTHR
uniref:Uncharacterized protein n=1 Tax=Plectus sambesii TaxID=2011161 RepID=A0A914VKM2_9BILA